MDSRNHLETYCWVYVVAVCTHLHFNMCFQHTTKKKIKTSTGEVVKCSIDLCIWTEEREEGLPEIFLYLPYAETSSVAQFYFCLAYTCLIES